MSTKMKWNAQEPPNWSEKVGEVSLLLKLKLNEFHICKQYCQVFIIDKKFQEKYKNKES